MSRGLWLVPVWRKFQKLELKYGLHSMDRNDHLRWVTSRGIIAGEEAPPRLQCNLGYGQDDVDDLAARILSRQAVREKPGGL
jgi:hypothetical protein